MRRFSIRLAVATILATLLGGQATTLAQGAGEGLMNAIAFKPLPQSSTFRVQALDNSDQNMMLKKEFERVLMAKGFTVNAEASLIITFETSDELGAYTTRNKRAFVELKAQGGRDGGEDASMRLNLYDSNSGGVFNRGKGETSIMTATQYRLDVSIDDRTNGKRHWQAWTVANVDVSDGAAMISAMIPEMIGNIGKTVKSRTFGLY